MSPNFTEGRGGHTVRGVVIHTTEGTYDGTIGWFTTEESRVSAHYLVGLDGRIAQFVGEDSTARHAGRVEGPTTPLYDGGDPNEYTVGIEFEDGGAPHDVERPDEQYASGAALLRGIAERWDVPLDRDHVVGHREIFSPKTCPGNVDIDRLIREARA